MENGDAVTVCGFDDRRCTIRRADNDDCVSEFDLRFERRPQRTRREYAAIADAAAAIDQQDSKVFGQRRILKAVVHNDHGRSVPPRGFGSCHAITRYDGWRKPRQQQRLVAHGGGRMPRRIDPHRPGQASAIAARQEIRTFVRGEEEASDLERCRRFAGAADGEVAQANHRHAGSPASRAACAALPPFRRCRRRG